MTFAEYFKQFKPESIRKQIDVDQASTTTAASYAERIRFILDVAAKDPVYPKDPSLDTTLLNQILIYSLYKLDRAKFYIVEGRRNIALDSKTLLDFALSDDPNMRSFSTIEIRREYVTVVMIATILYLAAMRKKVEIRTLLDLCADLNAVTLMKAFEQAQDMLMDCHRFGKGAYDRKVLQFMNQTRQSVGSVKQIKRAF